MDANTHIKVPQFAHAKVSLSFHIGKPKRWGARRPPACKFGSDLMYRVIQVKDMRLSDAKDYMLELFTFRNLMAYQWYKLRLWWWELVNKNWLKKND